MEDQDLAQEEQSETKNGQDGEKRNEGFWVRKLGKRRCRIYAGGGAGILRDTEMQVSVVNKVRRTRNSETEVGVLQALAILEYLALDNTWAESRKTKMAPMCNRKQYQTFRKRIKSKGRIGRLRKMCQNRKWEENHR